MTRIGLIGWGGIGRTVAAAFERAGRADALAGVLVRRGRAAAPSGGAGGPVLVESLDGLLAAGVEVVAEVAGQQAVAEHGEAVLEAGRDLMVVSIGALADEALYGRLRAAAARRGRRILLPAGAVGGIDVLSAMRVSGLESVTYRSRKPPAAWKGTPAEAGADLDALAEPLVLYRGNAREAALAFPRNANVAATVALAGLGFERTEVELVADPSAPGNVHEIEALGTSGRVSIRLEGRPSPENPKTSMLTALSVARALMNLDAPVVI